MEFNLLESHNVPARKGYDIYSIQIQIQQKKALIEHLLWISGTISEGISTQIVVYDEYLNLSACLEHKSRKMI